MLLAEGLPTSSKIVLGLVALAFIAFALISAFVLPRRNPDFPGKNGLRTYVVVACGFFLAMMLTVIFVAKESTESSAAESTTPVATGPSPADLAAGKTIFMGNGCGSCHTLQDAGTTGKVGPDLDQLKPTQEAVATQVTNGGGPMPPFKGTLSPAQIQQVATYVATVAGK